METKYRKSDIQGDYKSFDSINTQYQTKIPPRRLHYFFERQCDLNPHALALIGDKQQLSYAELDAQANQLANYFLCDDIGLGDRVGILLERSVHTYVTLLAILKCGAAFVPLDPSFPQDRIAFIASDASLDLLVTTASFKQAISGVSCPVLPLDLAAAAIAQQSATRIKIPDIEDELCYIIYTSGSTGRPKGVAVNHSNICNFLTVCTPIYGVTSSDRVYQGMIIAFDFSIEEIWPTFIVGATLVLGPTDHQRLGSSLADFLLEQKVTIMYCVPTLLATLDRDVPLLRTLIVGGEACPHDLVKRWSRPHRRILNTYGPTEATVTALWTELLPDKPVTIGRPLPTYSVYILDEDMHPVPHGEPGEICIGGIGVAQGYINLTEATAAKFVLDPFKQDSLNARMYRTGDLGRFTLNSEIEYLGRIDHQVKIRGYRIELTEIEAVLLENPEIENAIVSLVSNTVQELVAYITLRVNVAAPEELKNRLHTLLRSRLPSYMVPAFIEVLDAIPTLPNGKADRSKLPAPTTSRSYHSNYIPPATPLEQELANAWRAVFGCENISVEDDFFNDLGGHSLFAALVISKLRENPTLHHLSIADIYLHSTIRALAHHIKAQPSKSTVRTSTKHSDGTRKRHSNLRVWVCGAVQMMLLYLLFAILGIPSALLISKASSWSFLTLVVASIILIPLMWLLTVLVLPIAAKWLLIGRFRAGRYPLWGWYYCRWWLVRKIMTLAPLKYLAGSPLMPLYLRLLGGRIGKGCHIGSAQLHLLDLIEIGNEVSIGYSVEMQPFLIEDGWLYQAPIRVGDRAFVGTNSVLMLGGSIGHDARVVEQSLVARNQMIPDDETWIGSPSSQTTNIDPMLDKMADRKPSKLSYSPALWVGFVMGLCLLEILPLMIASPGWLLIHNISGGELLRELAAAPLAGILFVFTACTVVAVGKWIVMRQQGRGVYAVRSLFGLRKWFQDHLMRLSLDLTYTLYATLYTSPWLRLLGAKVGARAEVSTVSHIDPDLLTLGSESFVADLAAVGSARYYNGFVAIEPTEIGARCFVGNSALVPSNTRLGDGSLIGVHSLPPSEPVKPNTSWLGSPAIFLPNRQKIEGYDESVTFRPPVHLVACRFAIEFLRVILPSTLLYLLINPEIELMLRLADVLSLPLLIAIVPAVFLSFGCFATLLVVILKWLVVGCYQPRIKPLWSNFVWRTELITGLYENVAVPFLLRWFTGTPLLALFLRLFGAKIGSRVYMETTFLTEFDLVHVADDAAIAGSTSLQTHLFEDRVMKMSNVKIGRGCTIGPRSVVLYDSVMEAGSKLDALSLVMKSEVLPRQSQWQGIPSRSVD